MTTLKEVQDLNYELLAIFDDVCKRNGIEYFLIGGTLLGAVRHKDFIPWDDDLDIAVKRPEYEKLISLPASEWPEGFIISRPENRPYFLDFVTRLVNTKAKLIDFKNGMEEVCLGMDIFILDRACDGELSFKINVYRRLFTYALARGHRNFSKELDTDMPGIVDTLVARPVAWIGSKRSLPKLLKKYDDLSKKGSSDKYCLSNDEPSFLKIRLSSDDLNGTVDVRIRDRMFPAPAGYENLLVASYGNYMELPPEKDRRPAHWVLDDYNNEGEN